MPSDDCFDRFPLTYISGTVPAPTDANYPERAYVFHGASEYQFKFQLPTGLSGEMVLIQWHYVTANGGCMHIGYDQYDWPVGWLKPGTMPCDTGFVNAEQLSTIVPNSSFMHHRPRSEYLWSVSLSSHHRYLFINVDGILGTSR